MKNFGQKEVIFGNVPSKSNCYRIVTFKSKDPAKKSHASLAKSGKLKKYEKDFSRQCVKYRNAGIDEDFIFEIWVYYPSRRSDLDGSLKVCLDCLQKVVGAIKNDNLCQDIIAHRRIDTRNPRIEFVITALEKPVPELFDAMVAPEATEASVIDQWWK